MRTIETITVILFATMLTWYMQVTSGQLFFCEACAYISNAPLNAILEGTTRYPFSYRVLTPFLLWLFGGSPAAILGFIFIAQLAFYATVYAVIDDHTQALYMVCLSALLAILMLERWGYAHYTYIEWIALLWGWQWLLSPSASS